MARTLIIALVLTALPQEEEIRKWIGQLGSENPDIRDKATEALIKAGEPALKPCLEAEPSANAEVKARLDRIISAISLPEHRKRIRAKLADLVKEKEDPKKEVQFRFLCVYKAALSAEERDVQAVLPYIDKRITDRKRLDLKGRDLLDRMRTAMKGRMGERTLRTIFDYTSFRAFTLQDLKDADSFKYDFSRKSLLKIVKKGEILVIVNTTDAAQKDGMFDDTVAWIFRKDRKEWVWTVFWH